MHVDGHRLDIETGLLGLETGDIAQPMVERASALHDRGRRFGAVLVQRPRGVVDRQMAQDVHLGVGILEDRPATRLDEQHLARPEPPSPDRVGRFERHGARFGRDRYEAVGRDGESSRPQPVPVDERADPSTICEHDRGRAIPGRQHPGRPPPERGDVRMRSSPQSDRLGDRREQRRSEIPASRREQLQALVERERIGAIGREQRASVEQVGSDLPGAAVPRPTPDLLPVAADRVDLAVVRDRAERLGETPHGRRVRGVPLVEHGIRHIDVRAEIRVQVGEARPGDEALVDDGQRGHRGDRQSGDRATGGPRRRLDAPSGDDEAPLERPIARCIRPSDDRLGDHRPGGRRGRPERRRIERDLPPGHDRQAGVGKHALDQETRLTFVSAPPRQERHDDARTLLGTSPTDDPHQ